MSGRMLHDAYDFANLSAQAHQWNCRLDNFYHSHFDNYFHPFFDPTVVCEYCGGCHSIEQCNLYFSDYDTFNSEFYSVESKPSWNIAIEKLVNPEFFSIESKPPWEDAIEKFATVTSKRFEKLETKIDQLIDSSENIRLQLEKLVDTITVVKEQWLEMDLVEDMPEEGDSSLSSQEIQKQVLEQSIDVNESPKFYLEWITVNCSNEDEWYEVKFVNDGAILEFEDKYLRSHFKKRECARLLSIIEISFFWYLDGYSDHLVKSQVINTFLYLFSLI